MAHQLDPAYIVTWSKLATTGGANPTWTYVLDDPPQKDAPRAGFHTPGVVCVNYKGPKICSPVNMKIWLAKYETWRKGHQYATDCSKMSFPTAIVADVSADFDVPTTREDDRVEVYYITMAIWRAYVDYLAGYQVQSLRTPGMELHVDCNCLIIPNRSRDKAREQPNLWGLLSLSLMPLRIHTNDIVFKEQGYKQSTLDVLEMDWADRTEHNTDVVRRCKQRLDKLYLLDEGKTLGGRHPQKPYLDLFARAWQCLVMGDGVDVQEKVKPDGTVGSFLVPTAGNGKRRTRKEILRMDALCDPFADEMAMLALTSFHVWCKHDNTGERGEWPQPIDRLRCLGHPCPCAGLMDHYCDRPLMSRPPPWFTGGKYAWQTFLHLVYITEGLRNDEDHKLNLFELRKQLALCKGRMKQVPDEYITHDINALSRCIAKRPKKEELSAPPPSEDDGADDTLGRRILLSLMCFSHLPGRVYRTLRKEQIEAGVPSVVKYVPRAVETILETDFHADEPLYTGYKVTYEDAK